ncbi:alkaline phosphatase D family protein [Marininema halotolerans]|uniref:Alkaline phosphatase D n=1 Tax=Marininema halotolerans TaxID=1155944 RepID=A0A1I6QI69_9BACL|nr:alkaline phosphatase D family protein [Marininema halotolerans]SFS52124.1 alkaline phosphatase D [Marininema halotolerans]
MDHERDQLFARLERLIPSVHMDRRDFLKSIGKGAFLALIWTITQPLPGTKVFAMPRYLSYPFRLGVASGDPLPDGCILWTRLAPVPLKGGGMSTYDIPVRWEVAEDDQFQRVIRKGETTARATLGHSVHVDVRGLRPGREYFYRFKSGSDISAVGRTKTAPHKGDPTRRINLAYASCQQYEHGYYTAYQHMSREDLDVVLHLGDYIYEYGPEKYLASSGNVRRHNSPEVKSLGDYRNRYAQYRMDPDLQAAHAAFPWIVVWDDHEVDNNYAGSHPEHDQSPTAFLRRRAAAYQAYYEHMPMRLSTLPQGPQMKIYRRFTFGDLVEFNMLDTRQYRDNQVGSSKWSQMEEESLNPQRTMLGEVQENWLMKGLFQSKARWNVLAQQVFFSRLDKRRGGDHYRNMDAWDGYVASQHRLIQRFSELKNVNPIILTGDVHSNWACDLKTDYNYSRSPVVGSEFVGTSITSEGDGFDMKPYYLKLLANNDHVHFFNGQRGYVRCQITPEYWQTDYRILPYVSKPGAPIVTRESFVVEYGRPGIQKG